MTIGIIGAMDEEITAVREKMTDITDKTVAGCLFIHGKLFGHDVVLLKSGIGKVNAAMAATIMHEQFHPTYVINTGSAGGFSKELDVGDVVISTDIVHHDVDATAFDYAYGQVPGMPAMYSADAMLIEKTQQVIQRLGLNWQKGLIATGDSFMSDATRVSYVREKFPSMIAAEMEAAAIAQVCYQYETPFIVIRALSDIAGKDSSTSFDEFLETAAQNAGTLIMDMVKSI
ncbi:5'-methylthioadenosine/S-adenosylhomocysteine nucleosidase [Lentibacillus cibarius]|uniref:5'-methylthioadenosine/S-adenosylhomocysteine nucleosidase n=1 Tax=Lentibacillus cibarius TaxID=2583219 RepID=A0A549YLL5_9BACI|nr:5'-methylthioadenosine/S-adenosylhomocysteine nucleosidase [Lentibacillus cibarius]TRM12781.1 5'-methylthioadenosine/S-adenosylhomocysteine nucleosidase [Lentibacillus cibarius]